MLPNMLYRIIALALALLSLMSGVAAAQSFHTHKQSEQVSESVQEETTVEPADEEAGEESALTEEKPSTRAASASSTVYEYSPKAEAHTSNDSDTNASSTQHSTVCSKRSATTTEAHSFTHEDTTKPTLTSTGKRVYTCTACGYSYSETLAALDENLYFEFTNDTAAKSVIRTISMAASSSMSTAPQAAASGQHNTMAATTSSSPSTKAASVR